MTWRPSTKQGGPLTKWPPLSFLDAALATLPSTPAVFSQSLPQISRFRPQRLLLLVAQVDAHDQLAGTLLAEFPKEERHECAADGAVNRPLGRRGYAMPSASEMMKFASWFEPLI